jgi:spore coat polysaccharide biosynthesis predicted glycosyltransferase SpsG
VPPGVEPVDAPAGLTEHLVAADIVMCSAGVTLLEALALGRPTVGFVTVPGQERALGGCADAGAAFATTPDLAHEAAIRLLDDAVARRQLAAAARHCIDGRGAERVAEVVRGLA